MASPATVHADFCFNLFQEMNKNQAIRNVSSSLSFFPVLAAGHLSSEVTVLLRWARSVSAVASAINPSGGLYFLRVPGKCAHANESLSRCEECTRLEALDCQPGDSKSISRTTALVFFLSTGSPRPSASDTWRTG